MKLKGGFYFRSNSLTGRLRQLDPNSIQSMPRLSNHNMYTSSRHVDKIFWASNHPASWAFRGAPRLTLTTISKQFLSQFPPFLENP